MNSSETLEVTMHMVRDFFENKIFSTQRLLAHLAQTAESFNMEALPCGSVKVNVRTDLERSANDRKANICSMVSSGKSRSVF